MDPITMSISGLIITNTPHFLEALRSTLLDKGKELAISKGKKLLDEKEQQRHLEQVLKKAVRRGLTKFRKPAERDQYRDILTVLFEPGTHSDTLRREVMNLFSLSDTLNVAELNEIYNQSLRSRNLSQPIPPPEIDAAPYLKSFFDALIVELYADSIFKQQMSETLQAWANVATVKIQQSTADTAKKLDQICELIADDYTEEQFKQDVATYTAHIERILHNLKIVGVVPKDQNRDPELNGIFVPLRIALQDQAIAEDEKDDSIVDLLEKYPHMVLLGGPGSGKSTAIRHLAWSHAAAKLSPSSETELPLLPGKPLPLRIELRLFTQVRKHQPDYDFLSYAVKVLLGGEGIKINPLMFNKLLNNKSMLILFDGLDEVTTLDERKRLVEEIEHFVQLYPGNRVLVTSRPVGYDLASCSKQLFSHAYVQDFNDEQIHQFLENWYIHVLRLSPIPQQEQQELETLYTTLKDNPRLHKLAENPLLLTVITALYRSERLPDRRVQVYDRCASLLLETWAKLKGTDTRWKEIKMEKEDQYACVAHLGYVLHKQSQEADDEVQYTTTNGDDTASDVPTKFMLREIEHFLKDRRLITEGVEQRAEAKRFLELMQVEAGLIVERGKDEDDEELYGFVHRTFQEYFAAMDVYERFQQEVDLTIISDFLIENLHDPHWREVILLLLGKLKPKPITNLLRQILEDEIKSRRSHYIDILQQDLFFVCDCLVEEISVESTLAQLVVARLSDLVKQSSFRPQRMMAVKYLGRLMQTRQYTKPAQEALVALIAKDNALDMDTKIEAAAILYTNSPSDFEEKRQAIQILLDLSQHCNLSVEQRIQAAHTLYLSSVNDSEEERQAAQVLVALAQDPDLSIKKRIQAAQALSQSSPSDSKERRQAKQILLEFAQNQNLSLWQRIQAVQALFSSSPTSSEGERQIRQVLLDLAQDPDLSIEQRIQVAQALYVLIPSSSEERRQAKLIFLDIVRSQDLLFEQRIRAAQALHNIRFLDKSSHHVSEEKQQIRQVLLDLAQDPDLSIEQRIRAAQVVYPFSSSASEERQQARQVLLDLSQNPAISVEHSVQVAQVLYQFSPKGSQEGQRARQVLLQSVQRTDVPVEQRIQAAQAFYQFSFSGPFNLSSSKEKQQLTQTLWQLARDQSLTVTQRLSAVKPFLADSFTSYADKFQAVRLVATLLPLLEAMEFLREHWADRLTLEGLTPETLSDIPYLVELVQEPLLTTEIRDKMYQSLRKEISQFNKIDMQPVS